MWYTKKRKTLHTVQAGPGMVMHDRAQRAHRTGRAQAQARRVGGGLTSHLGDALQAGHRQGHHNAQAGANHQQAMADEQAGHTEPLVPWAERERWPCTVPRWLGSDLPDCTAGPAVTCDPASAQVGIFCVGHRPHLPGEHDWSPAVSGLLCPCQGPSPPCPRGQDRHGDKGHR